MSLFDKFDRVHATRRDLDALGIDPFGAQVDEITSATEGVIRGNPVILAGTNNYLGLTFDADCIAAAAAAVKRHGTGTTGSRMANGSYAGHTALEREIAALYDWPHAIVFSTGYLANLGMISTLTAPGDVVLIDADCHASIYDGCRLGGGEIIRFRHNDASDLAKRLRRLGTKSTDTLIVVEGIYSMLGDTAPLAGIVEVKRRYGARLLVDEAHSLGVLGDHGRGVCESAGVQQDVDFVVGTFSKSLGATGGFCASPLEELELVRYASRPYIFTASPSPSVIASTRVALEKLVAGNALREKLWRHAARLHTALNDLGFTLGAPPSPILAVLLPDRDRTLSAWQWLLSEGVYVNLMIPPATPGGVSLLRCSLSAAHTDLQIDRIIGAFAGLARTMPAVLQASTLATEPQRAGQATAYDSARASARSESESRRGA